MAEKALEEKKNRKIPSNIKPEKLSRSFLAYLLDLLFMSAFIFICYYSLGRPVILPAVGYESALVEFDSFMERSGLVQVDHNAHTPAYYRFEDEEGGKKAYEKYIDVIWNYFTVELMKPDTPYVMNPERLSKVGDKDYVPFEGEKSVEALGKYVYANFFDTESVNALWAVPLTNGVKDYAKAPVAVNPNAYRALKEVMYDSGVTKGIYINVVTHLVFQPSYNDYTNKVNFLAWTAIMPFFGIAPVVFMYVMPLLLRSGRTLGKLIAGTAVISASGYSAPWYQVLAHYSFPSLYWMMLMLPYQGITFPIFLGLHVIDWIFLVLSKNHQSGHDKLSYTIVIDGKRSVWFVSKEAEEEYILTHPSSLVARLRKEEEKKSSDISFSEAQSLAADMIVDSSTIGKAREVAKTITSFDEFENKEEKGR